MNIIREVENTSLDTFEKIKHRTEKKWKTAVVKNLWGNQVQKDSKWKPGLSDKEVESFEEAIGFTFPEPLRNFYKTMNGLDKPGIDISGNLNSEPIYKPVFYSFPEDLELIKSQTNLILEEYQISVTDIKNLKAPFIFPYYGHRFLVFDENKQVLSIFGKDIIIWADNLAKAIVNDVFDLNYNEIKSMYTPVKFWLEDI